MFDNFYNRCIVMFYSEELMKRAANISRDNLVNLGTCFGKFTKTRKFRLHITALDFLAPYAKVGQYDGFKIIFSLCFV